MDDEIEKAVKANVDSAKTITKISLWISLLGWFPFMWMAMWGESQEVYIRIAVTMTGLALCMIGPLMSLVWTSNPILWKNTEELELLRAHYRQSKAKYEKAHNEFVNNQNITHD